MKPPAYLDREARAVWREVVAALSRTRAVHPLDRPALEALCVQVARMRDARARIDEEGMIVAGARERPEPHPALAIERAASEQARKWYVQLGLDPPHRTAEEGDADDGLDDLAAKRAARRAKAAG